MLILLQNGEYDLIWINRIYLLFMAVIYGTIGVWAILDQAIKRENLKLSGSEELSIRVYDSLDTGTSRVDF